MEAGSSETVTVGAPYKLITGKVELTKKGENFEEAPLEGATFELQDSDGETIKENLTTIEKGKLTVNGLKPGEYQFIETEAPVGYKIDDTSISFTIERSKTEEDVELVTVTAENELGPNSVELEKVDSSNSNSNRTLEDAEFKLQQKNEEGEYETIGGKTGLTTDKDGIIVVKGIEDGEYQFVETKAPAGYRLDKTPLEFTVVLGQTETKTFEMENYHKLVKISSR